MIMGFCKPQVSLFKKKKFCSEAQMRMFGEYVQDAMNQHNKLASSSDT